MAPTLSEDDGRYDRLGYPHHVADLLLTVFAGGIELSYAPNVPRCDGGHVVAFTTGSIEHNWHNVSSLLHFIRCVVGVSANEQVVWTNACRVVAVVADNHAVGDGSKMQFPGKAMGAHMSAADQYLAISPSSDMLINPASIGLCYGSPETFNGWPSLTSLSHSSLIASDRPSLQHEVTA